MSNPNKEINKEELRQAVEKILWREYNPDYSPNFEEVSEEIVALFCHQQPEKEYELNDPNVPSGAIIRVNKDEKPMWVIQQPEKCSHGTIEGYCVVKDCPSYHYIKTGFAGGIGKCFHPEPKEEVKQCVDGYENCDMTTNHIHPCKKCGNLICKNLKDGKCVGSPRPEPSRENEFIGLDELLMECGYDFHAGRKIEKLHNYLENLLLSERTEAYEEGYRNRRDDRFEEGRKAERTALVEEIRKLKRTRSVDHNFQVEDELYAYYNQALRDVLDIISLTRKM